MLLVVLAATPALLLAPTGSLQRIKSPVMQLIVDPPPSRQAGRVPGREERSADNTRNPRAQQQQQRPGPGPRRSLAYGFGQSYESFTLGDHGGFGGTGAPWFDQRPERYMERKWDGGYGLGGSGRSIGAYGGESVRQPATSRRLRARRTRGAQGYSGDAVSDPMGSRRPQSRSAIGRARQRQQRATYLAPGPYEQPQALIAPPSQRRAAPVHENQGQRQAMLVRVPGGKVPGDRFKIVTEWGWHFDSTVPVGASPGQTISVALPLRPFEDAASKTADGPGPTK